MCKMWMVLLTFFANVTGKMRMRTQYYKLKKHNFLEIFIVGITLGAIYVRHKTSHRHKSWVNGGHVPQTLYLGDDNDVLPSGFST